MKAQDIADLKQLIEFLKEYQVAEFDLDRGDLKIRLKFNQQETAPAGLNDLPVCILAITVLHPRARQKRNWAWIPVAFLLVWGTYRFSFGPMTEHVASDAAGQGGIFAKIPTPLLHALETLPVPAPQL